MQDTLAQIRENNPLLDEIETYRALVEAVKAEIIDEQFELLENAMEQYHDRLDDVQANSENRFMLRLAKEVPSKAFAKWFDGVKIDHDYMNEMYGEIKDLADVFTNKDRIPQMVDEKIKQQWPEFYNYCQDKIKWNEIRQAQLARQEEAKLNGPSGNSTEISDPGQTR